MSYDANSAIPTTTRHCILHLKCLNSRIPSVVFILVAYFLMFHEP